MKKSAPLIAALLLALSLTGCTANKPLSKYELKSGMIKYELSGDQVGTQTHYFDDFGRKEVIFSDISSSFGGSGNTLQEVSLTVDGRYYLINLQDGTGTETDAITPEFIKEDDELSILEQQLSRSGAKKLGQEIILDRETTLWAHEELGTRTYIYKGLVLKNATQSVMHSSIVDAVEFEENIEIDPTLFEVPDGIEFRERSELNQEVIDQFNAF